MYSIVPLIGRRTAVPVTIDEITLPSGSAVEINIHAINHNPSVWPDYEVLQCGFWIVITHFYF